MSRVMQRALSRLQSRRYLEGEEGLPRSLIEFELSLSSKEDPLDRA